jgi:hypothetical protein
MVPTSGTLAVRDCVHGLGGRAGAVIGEQRKGVLLVDQRLGVGDRALGFVAIVEGDQFSLRPLMPPALLTWSK